MDLDEAKDSKVTILEKFDMKVIYKSNSINLVDLKTNNKISEFLIEDEKDNNIPNSTIFDDIECVNSGNLILRSKKGKNPI